MIEGLSLDTAYLLDSLCPFDVRGFNLPFSVVRSAVSFYIGHGQDGTKHGVLLNFDLCSDSDFDKSYELSTFRQGEYAVHVLNPKARSGKHQLITGFPLDKLTNCGFTYGYWEPTPRHKSTKVTCILARDSNLCYDDYTLHTRNLGVLLETSIRPRPMKITSGGRAVGLDGKLLCGSYIDCEKLIISASKGDTVML